MYLQVLMQRQLEFVNSDADLHVKEELWCTEKNQN
jgi:hypothetical protein